jgi:predicted nucleotide-binding protein
LIGASAAYGLTEGSFNAETISITEIGKKIISQKEDETKQTAMKEAFLRPRVIKSFLEKYHNAKLPHDRIAKNILEEIGVPSDSTEQAFNLILSGAKQLGLVREVKGSFWVDLDRVPSDTSNSTDNSDNDDEPPNFEPTNNENNLPKEKSNESVETSKNFSPSEILDSTKPKNNRVFITHGKNKEIVNQLKEILTFGKFVPVVAEDNQTISKPVPTKVLDEMKSCSAGIIHVGKEIKLLDQKGDEHIFLNQNVLIEIGAAMALYNGQFILLVETGTQLPSNLQGLYEVRYDGDELDYQATMKLLKAFNDFNLA